jgi:hypothetical protein
MRDASAPAVNLMMGIGTESLTDAIVVASYLAELLMTVVMIRTIYQNYRRHS